MDDSDSNGGKFGNVHDLVAVQIVDLDVGDEIEIIAVDGTGWRQDGELGVILEHACLRYPVPVSRKLKCSQARRADAVLDGNQAALVPGQAVSAGQRAARAGIEVATLAVAQVNLHDTHRVCHINRLVVI